MGWSFLLMGVLSILLWLFNLSFSPITLFGIVGINALGVNELMASAKLKGSQPHVAGKRLIQNQIIALIYMVLMILPILFIDVDRILIDWEKNYNDAYGWLTDLGGVLEMDVRESLRLGTRLMSALLFVAVVPTQTMVILYYRRLVSQLPQQPLPPPLPES
ncbi:MAG: hypothetical protein SFY80_04965 [Verrucomicrobiota bacterium]|nr:hypothetical protein [Verrucomicrobiota bacterium]